MRFLFGGLGCTRIAAGFFTGVLLSLVSDRGFGVSACFGSVSGANTTCGGLVGDLLGGDFFIVARLADAVDLDRSTNWLGFPTPLLLDVGQLMDQEAIALRVAGVEHAGVEEDISADGEGLGIERLGHPGGILIGMDTHIAQIGHQRAF